MGPPYIIIFYNKTKKSLKKYLSLGAYTYICVRGVIKSIYKNATPQPPQKRIMKEKRIVLCVLFIAANKWKYTLKAAPKQPPPGYPAQTSVRVRYSIKDPQC